MYDWNNNGKYDAFDSGMDYYIINEMENDEHYSSGNNGGSFLTLLGTGLLVFGILLILGMVIG